MAYSDGIIERSVGAHWLEQAYLRNEQEGLVIQHRSATVWAHSFVWINYNDFCIIWYTVPFHQPSWDHAWLLLLNLHRCHCRSLQPSNDCNKKMISWELKFVSLRGKTLKLFLLEQRYNASGKHVPPFSRFIDLSILLLFLFFFQVLLKLFSF